MNKNSFSLGMGGRFHQVSLLKHSMVLTSSGDGSGVAELAVEVSVNTKATISGDARFYTDSLGTENESTTWMIESGESRSRYMRCPNGSSVVKFTSDKIISIGRWVSGLNAPVLSANLNLLKDLSYVDMGSNSELFLDITQKPNLKHLNYTGSSVIIGDVTNITTLEYLSLSGRSEENGNNSISGNVTNLTLLKYVSVWGNNTLSGNINNLSQLTHLACGGMNTLTGDTSNLPLLQWYEVEGNNTITSSTILPNKALSGFFNSKVPLNTSNVNQLLADLWVNRDEAKPLPDRGEWTRYIDFRGSDVTGIPTGQGLIDKRALECYRSPNNDSAKRLWKIITRHGYEELINQIAWNFVGGEYWNRFDECFSGDNVKLSLNGGSGYIQKQTFWDSGQIYRVRASVNAVSGILFLPASDFSITKIVSQTGSYSYPYKPNESVMQIYSSSFVGDITELSIKKAVSLINNGNFADSSKWSAMSGWTISGGVAMYDKSLDAGLSQYNADMAEPLIAHTPYILVFDVAISSGHATLFILDAAGTYTYIGKSNYTNGHYEIPFTPEVSSLGIMIAAYPESSNPFSISNVKLY